MWHPLSALLLPDPPCFATPALVGMALGGGGGARLTYAGDRMWPALAHGASVAVERVRLGELADGAVVVASTDGVPDLLRIRRLDGDTVQLAADGDPQLSLAVPAGAVLALARLPRRRSGRLRRVLRRLALDVAEAWRGAPDRGGGDAAASVRLKYEAQAPFYVRAQGPDLEPALLRRVRRRVSAGGRVLVVGSGTGRECFALAGEGFRVCGVDFAPAMVRLAAEEARRRGLRVELLAHDVRRLRMEPGSLSAVLFTYDVYSFLPDRRRRVELLLRMRSWLEPGGLVLLSARRLRSPYERGLLTLQWLAALRRGESEWGRSHTRWISGEGTLRRSFVHVFSERGLRAEVARAGFRMDGFEGGHSVLTPVAAAGPAATMHR